MSRFAIFFVLLFCCSPIAAQMHIGPNIGLVRSTLRLSPLGEVMPNPSEFLLGTSFGFSAQYFFKPWLSAESGIRSSREGFVVEFNRDPTNSSTKRRQIFDVIEIPLNILFYHGDEKMNIYGGFGLSYCRIDNSLRTSSSLGFGLGFFGGGILIDPFWETVIRENDLRSNYILGFSFLKNRTSIFFEMRHQRGHTDIVVSSPLVDTGYARSWSSSMGIKIRLGKKTKPDSPDPSSQ